MRKSLLLLAAAMVTLSVLMLGAGFASASHGDTTGNVTDASDDSNVSGATVTALNTSDGSEVASATTDSDGSYSLHLDDGDYDIEVSADGYVLHEETVTVAGATTADFALTPEFHEETVAIDNDTTHVWIDVLDTNGTDVDVEIFGVDEDGNETSVNSVVLNSPDGDTYATHEEEADPDTYEEYRIVVSGTGDEPAEVEVGVIQRTSGGASASSGNFLDGSTAGIPNTYLVVVFFGLVGFAVLRD